jgi:hypothetical protein
MNQAAGNMEDQAQDPNQDQDTDNCHDHMTRLLI